MQLKGEHLAQPEKKIHSHEVRGKYNMCVSPALTGEELGYKFSEAMKNYRIYI